MLFPYSFTYLIPDLEVVNVCKIGIEYPTRHSSSLSKFVQVRRKSSVLQTRAFLAAQRFWSEPVGIFHGLGSQGLGHNAHVVVDLRCVS